MNIAPTGASRGARTPARTHGDHDPPRRSPLTRRRVVRAALRIMDEDGLDAVTMRHVGRDLGVEAMSLYNHVRDKDDLLQAICEEVLAGFTVTPFDDWAEGARIAAREYRRLLLAHPHVITLMSAQKGPMTNPDSLLVYEHALAIFAAAGLDTADAVRAFNAFGGYILGYVTMELGLMVGGPHDDVHAHAYQQMTRLLRDADLPRLREALPHLADCDVDQQFEFGLDLLIEGLRARSTAPGRSSASAVNGGRAARAPAGGRS